MPDEIEQASKLAGAIPVVGTAVSALGSVYGAIKGAQANKANEELLQKQMEENRADYNLNGQRDFLETAAAKGAVREQKEALENNRKAVAGRAVITGASDEAVVAGNTGAQRNYTDAISRIAGMGTDYQQRERGMYRQNLRQLYGVKMGMNAQKAESAANLSANSADLLNTMVWNSGMRSNQDSGSVEKVSSAPVLDPKLQTITDMGVLGRATSPQVGDNPKQMTQ